jgi:hypothetical protein
MENVADKSCRENQNTRFMFNNFFFLKIALFIIPKKCGDRGTTPYITTCRILVACCISKATCPYLHAHAHTAGYQHK